MENRFVKWKRNRLIGKIILLIMIVGFVVIAKNIIFDFFNIGKDDLKKYANLSKEQLEKKLGISLLENKDLAKKLVIYTKNVTLYGNNDISVVYFNGEPAGLHTDSGKYSAGGINIGDSYDQVEKSLVNKKYTYTYYYEDEFNGYSVCYFYFNKEKNDCIAVTFNKFSMQVVALTYYDDYEMLDKQMDAVYD